jgi:hypothetical protein
VFSALVGPLACRKRNRYHTWIARGLKMMRSRLLFLLVESGLILVGDTGFEPVTSSV